MSRVTPETLRVLRVASRQSQTEIATRAGLSQTSYSRIERGAREATEEELSRIVVALGIDSLEAIPHADQLVKRCTDRPEPRT